MTGARPSGGPKIRISLLEKAISIAVGAHRGQKDKAGLPYILHVLSVMNRVETGAEKIVAILHDVVEDTKWMFEDLKREGFPDDLLQASTVSPNAKANPTKTSSSAQPRTPLLAASKLLTWRTTWMFAA